MYKVASSTDFFNPIVHILYTAYSEKFEGKENMARTLKNIQEWLQNNYKLL